MPPTQRRTNSRASLVESGEVMNVQGFVAQASVETLDVPVLHGLDRIDPVQRDPALVDPSIQGAVRELRAVVHHEQSRLAVHLDRAIESARDPHA
jgi:hypothetical protein